MTIRFLTLAAAAVLTVAACSGGAKAARPAPRNRNLITADEIATLNVSNAYEIVERLRPAFLRTRGAQSTINPDPPTPKVYLDGVPLGALGSLFNISANAVVSIQYMDAIEATQHFGMGTGGGAILVVTKH